MKINLSLLLPIFLISTAVLASEKMPENTAAQMPEKTVIINKISALGIGSTIGSVKLADGPNGLIITPNLAELAPGAHGFHIHTNPSCAAGLKDDKPVAGLAAGGHYDPATSNKHEGPNGAGHMGDMPILQVAMDGTATQPIVVPRLKIADVLKRAIIIHEAGDNYSDSPKPLGGGAGRVACGIIE